MRLIATHQPKTYTSRALSFCLMLVFVTPPASFAVPAQRAPHGYSTLAYKLSPQDDKFLEDLSKRSFQFFWEQGNARTGLVADRAFTDGRPYTPERD
ncbi:MAG: hypothetical protein H0U81_13765, partial [Pyrinomonadaceae bacterium]|nr:hypothetical protein [Pyrinomonadaceae bacterium]